MKKALANHAEQVYQKLSETQQKAARHIFVQLVRPGEGTEDTRRIATRKEIGDENWGLVSDLAGYTARLVVTGYDEKSEEDTVEVVHEALIREWQTLREWMKKDRLFRAWQERLRDIIHQWEETKHDEGVLLRGVPLSEAEEKLQQRREELSLSEQSFIQLSIQVRDRYLRQEKARKRREFAGISTAVVSILTILGWTAWNQSQQAKLNSAIADHYSEAFIVMAHSGDKKRALDEFSKVLHINPNSANAYYNRGNAHLNLGDNKGAIDDYNQALRLNPNYDLAYKNRGNARSAQGDKKGAIDDYNQALRLNPNFAVAYYNRGNAHNDLGDKKKAIDDYNQALRLAPNYGLAYIARGNIRSHLGDDKGAIDDYNQALRLNPNNALAYIGRGNIRSHLGDNKDALDDYNQALRLNPNYALAYNNRGLLREKLGDYRGALEDYNQALRLNPNYADAYNNRKSLLAKWRNNN